MTQLTNIPRATMRDCRTHGSALRLKAEIRRRERIHLAFYASVFCLVVLLVAVATEPHLMVGALL